MHLWRCLYGLAVFLLLGCTTHDEPVSRDRISAYRVEAYREAPAPATVPLETWVPDDAPMGVSYEGEGLYERGYEPPTPLRPEPFSHMSGRRDPELLGRSEPSRDLPVRSSPSTVRRSIPLSVPQCIAKLGKARFDRYLVELGSVLAARKKCTIVASAT